MLRRCAPGIRRADGPGQVTGDVDMAAFVKGGHGLSITFFHNVLSLLNCEEQGELAAW